LQFFRTHGFRYSLSPGEYKKNDLDQFLFHRRTGFCEHYAASFATLMRLAGVPARVVVGYLGGEYNDLGRFFLVRQADTHAWCEVWLPDSGWTRVDPTGVVAPGRASLDLNSFLERRIASGQMESRRNAFVTQLARSAIFTNIRDRKSTRLNSSHVSISYAVFCLKKKKLLLKRHVRLFLS